MLGGRGGLTPEAGRVGAPAPAPVGDPCSSGVVTCSFLSGNRVSLPAAIRRFTRLTLHTLQTFDKEAKYTSESEEAWAAVLSAWARRSGLRGASPPRAGGRLGPPTSSPPRVPTPPPPPPPHTHTQIGPQTRTRDPGRQRAPPGQPEGPWRKKGALRGAPRVAGGGAGGR